jgi:SAM-dependent methyltransferase
MADTSPPSAPSQSLAVKRAQVEFHNFASMGEPQLAQATYAEENERRGALLNANLDLVRSCSPFLEIGANAAHTSYWLANHHQADGFALDISADALRHGQFLKQAWNFDRAPVLVAGDATRLPFRSGSFPLVMVFQTLSQFQNISSVVAEAARVLAPGGTLYLAEEPIRRRLTLNLYRAPYPQRMGTLERRLFDAGWLDFLARDVIGAHQEESFGIRQNHRLSCARWHDLLHQHFSTVRLLTFPRLRGAANRWAHRWIQRFSRNASDSRVADLLGATIAAFCVKAGSLPPQPASLWDALACPACLAPVSRTTPDSLACSSCNWSAAADGGVFNLLPPDLRDELYPKTARPDCLDFSKPGHEFSLISGFHQLEGSFGNRYRWIGDTATATLQQTVGIASKLRVRGFAPEEIFSSHRPRVTITINHGSPTAHTLSSPGLFVLEVPAPPAARLDIIISVSHSFPEPGDPPATARRLSVNISLLRLVPIDDNQTLT